MERGIGDMMSNIADMLGAVDLSSTIDPTSHIRTMFEKDTQENM